MSKSVLLCSIFFVVSGALLPSLAHAHVGVGETSGFMHPLSGLDHVCAMIAVGLWAAQMGGRSVWAVPFTFVSVMALGSALPMMGVDLPFVEQGIALSVLMLGMLIAALVRLPLWLGVSLVGLFALWHGHAHGAEMSGSTATMTYLFGFMLSMALLHVVGIIFGLCLQWLEGGHKRIVQGVGASIALYGAYLVIS